MRIHRGQETMNAAESRFLRDAVRNLVRVGAVRRSKRFADGGGELPVVCSPAYARWDEALGQYRQEWMLRQSSLPPPSGNRPPPPPPSPPARDTAHNPLSSSPLVTRFAITGGCTTAIS